MFTHRRSLSAALAVVFALVLAACGGSDSSTEATDSAAAATDSDTPLKVAFIYNGDPKGGSWDRAHDDARQKVQKHFGDKVETSFKASVPQNNQAAQVIEGLVQDGNKIIFATSFGYNKFMEQAAQKYKDVKFLQMDQAELMDNLGSYSIGSEDGFYAAGMMLASASKSGQIGFVGSFPVPSVMRVVNSVQLGAQQINPKARVRPVMTNTWYDPAKERQAAESLLSSGADVLTDNVGDPAVAQVAATRKVPYVGIMVDTRSFAKDGFVTAVTFNYEPYYTKQIESVIAGTWKSDSEYLRMPGEGIVLAKYGPAYRQVKEADREKIDAAIAKIKGGWEPFTGPIKDQSGKLKVPDGEALPIADLHGMDWYAQGVAGAKKVGK